MRKLAVCGESGKQYPVFLGWDLLERDDWLEEIKFPSSFGVIVTNSRVGSLYEERVSSFFSRQGFTIQVVTIPDGEEYKNLSTVEFIYKQLLNLDLDRKSFLLALGGGAVSYTHLDVYKRQREQRVHVFTSLFISSNNSSLLIEDFITFSPAKQRYTS